MAGDWIKVEHATLDKPEVAYFAELMGVNVDEALGILLRFFVWLDRNARNGAVTPVTRLALDTTMHCPGFSAAIVTSGWAEIDEATRTLNVPHFERHNENPSKSRSSNAERQARFRERQRNGVTKKRNVTSNAVTLPEKRREEKELKHMQRVTPPVTAKTTKRALPTAFCISDRVRAWAAEKGQGHLQARLEHFVGAAKAKGYKYVDWDEAFMNAIRDDWAKLSDKPEGSGRSTQVAL